MPLQPKKWISKLKPYPHGGIDHAEIKALGINPDEVMDFSVCTNPFMPPPWLKSMIQDFSYEQYPDSETTTLREKLAPRLHISPDNILAGNGTTEIIRLITTVYFRVRDISLILEPAYGDYEAASRIAGAQVIKYRAQEADNFKVKTDDLVEIIRKRQPRAVFICNPNNPTGIYLPQEDIKSLLNANSGGLLVLDEAYINFTEKKWDSMSLINTGNIIILRSMTKDYGIPGLRLGYAVANREIISILRRVCPPWNVNSIAQKAGVAILQKPEDFNNSLAKVAEASQFLMDHLVKMGFSVMPSDTHYFLVKVGNARNFRSSLLKHSILTRDCASFGLPEYIRISPRTLPECQKLVEAIRHIKQHKDNL